ncbi:hypothetical protein B7494_g2491 [Chlorociboria aeruginascens]|nr:hypothetical protein B7494_g2491 [Chlorociboria aeruginascens]
MASSIDHIEDPATLNQASPPDVHATTNTGAALPVEHHHHQHAQRAFDPALNPENQHVHEHTQHGHLAQGDDLVYAHSVKSTHLDGDSTGSMPQKSETAIGAKDLGINSQDLAEDAASNRHAQMWKKYRVFVHLFIGLFFTGWWIGGLVKYRRFGWLIPFLLWLAITIRLVTFHIPIMLVTKPIKFVWRSTISRAVSLIPGKLRYPVGGFGAVAVILVGTFASAETADNTRANRAVSLFGLVVFIFLFWVTSNNRKLINWHAVIVGMLSQFILALFVLRTKAGYDIFNFISFLASSLLNFSHQGAAFLTSDLALTWNWFVISVVPAIVFFVAFIQLLYYWGLLQWAIGKFAMVFFWGMRVSGAEAVVAAASPFVGQGESAMLIKPFIEHLTLGELHQIMTSGFATISGSVLSAYIAMGISPVALLSSCIMSIPASLAMSKLRYPETEDTLTSGRVIIPESKDEKPTNGLHAFAMGSWLGLKVGVMIVTCLLCILSLLGLANGLLTWFGHYMGIGISTAPLTVQLILGYICYPLAFLLGVERNGDLFKVAQLIGTKIVANEFVAFAALSTDSTYADLSPRSRLIATYALCGFGNISSIGIQTGVLSQLAPGRSGAVAKVALSALITGIIATLSSASIAGPKHRLDIGKRREIFGSPSHVLYPDVI